MAAIEVRRAGIARRAQMIGAALALLALGEPALAQPAYGPSAADPSPDAAMRSLHDALRLSPSQEAAWQAYSAQVALAAQARARQQAAARMMPSLEAPRRMDLIEAEMRQELTDLQGHAQALKSLYALLTPAQRKTFDQRTLPPPSGR